MCGIVGAINFATGAEPVDQTIVRRIGELQSHRGPDGHELWASEDSSVVFGHQRLAIIDIGAGGVQPMADASNRWIITFNGEIYNYQALRAELETFGCVFRTASDTEVLINAIACWGEAALLKLRGMFAFALWDSLKRELWLARDPYGIKPLYVAQTADTVWFASQARPLARAAPIDIRRDPAALTGFYLWGHVPEPFSWWAGIQMLPAGHVQRIKFGEAPAKAKPFALLQDAYLGEPREPLAPGKLRNMMLDSLQHHLVSDVPVGVFLSAGIDSTVLAALAAELGAKLSTVTLAFDEYAGTSNDEAFYAEATAQELGTEHVTVRIKQDMFEGMLDDFLEHMDQPTIDGLNTYLVSHAAAKQGLKVALSGLGGDELFGGYPSFRQIPQLVSWTRRVSKIPPLKSLVRGMSRWAPLLHASPKLAGVIDHSSDISSAYLLRRALHLENELDALLDESWINEGLMRLQTLPSLHASIAMLSGRSTPYAQVASLESCWYMRNQLLRDTDWSSMAHGLEVRVPYADWHLLTRLGPAIASATPPSKQDLAVSVKSISPGFAARPKTGFTTPIRDWIGARPDASGRGLRSWAENVHRNFRVVLNRTVPQMDLGRAA